MLSGSHIQTALKAAGAGSGLVIPASEIAELFNEAIRLYGKDQFNTVETVAAFVSECMMESAYFRTTEEYNKSGRYAPFIGRTFIQITWQKNYLNFGKWCFEKGLVPSEDYFVSDPKRLSDIKWAALGGVWYFTSVIFHGRPLTSYASNIDQIGKAVNLGNPFSSTFPNGYKARRAAYKAVLALGSAILPTESEESDNVMYSSEYKTEYVKWRGGYFAPITVEKLLSIPTFVRVTQGGLSFAPASAKTHAGIGVFDLNTDGMNKDQVWQMGKELWEVDIIPCPRGFSADSFQGKTISNTNDGNEHMHCLDRDCFDNMHWQGKAQCSEVMSGGDGLQGNRSYVGPSKDYRKSWKESIYNPANIIKPEDIKPGGVYVVVSNTLLGLDFYRKPKQNTTRSKGYEVTADRLVFRWGRWNAVTSSNTYYAISDDKEIYMEEKK